MKSGDVVHIDADTEEYGRVVGPATIIEAEEVGLLDTILGRGRVLVDAHSIQANIFVERSEVSRRCTTG